MNMDREDKVLIGVGIAGILALSTIALVLSKDKAKPKKTSYGLKVGPQCSTWEFTDATKAQDLVADLVDSESRKGTIDPFQLASAWLRAAAGECHAYPEQARNPGEASLYRDTFNEVLYAMRERQLLSEEMDATYKEMIDTWATSQGVEIGLA
jgi:hypothetical protein